MAKHSDQSVHSDHVPFSKSTIETKNSESKKLTNPNHIEFEPTNERDSDNFKALLTKELKLRLTREGRIAALSLDL